MKNHLMVNNKLLQTNKGFSQLKNSQKEKIANWTQQSYNEAIFQNLNSKEIDLYVINNVSNKIKAADIWLPNRELIKYYNSKKVKLKK